jgi:hypothetical protein
MISSFRKYQEPQIKESRVAPLDSFILFVVNQISVSFFYPEKEGAAYG